MTIDQDKVLAFNKKVRIFLLFLKENICCGYSLEAPRRGASNEYPQHIFLLRNNKKRISLIWRDDNNANNLNSYMKKGLIACANNERPDQPAHSHHLNKVVVVHSFN